MVVDHSSLKPAGSIRRRPKDASMHRMPLSRDDRKSREVFARKYGKPLSRVERERERLVFGGNFGCDGYTTPAQAAALPVQLELAPGRWLLDLGSGRGWPGLYLAKLTGCRTVLADLPVQGLAQAMRRRENRLAGRVSAVVAAPRQLPFRRASFDAIIHTDVLC